MTRDVAAKATDHSRFVADYTRIYGHPPNFGVDYTQVHGHPSKYAVHPGGVPAPWVVGLTIGEQAARILKRGDVAPSHDDLCKCTDSGICMTIDTALAEPPLPKWMVLTRERITGSLYWSGWFGTEEALERAVASKVVLSVKTIVADGWISLGWKPKPAAADAPKHDVIPPDARVGKAAKDFIDHLIGGKSNPTERKAVKGAIDKVESPLEGKAKSDAAVGRAFRFVPADASIVPLR